MRKITSLILLVGILGLSGCGPPSGANYGGDVQIIRVNGQIQYFNVRFPGSQYSTTIRDKAAAYNAIEQME